MDVKHSHLYKSIKFSGYCLKESVRHPTREIVYIGNPSTRKSKPLPWIVSLSVMFVGSLLWCLSVHWGAPELKEAAHPMVYLSLGNMFGMGVQKQ